MKTDVRGVINFHILGVEEEKEEKIKNKEREI